jgi:hypothetical protein
MTLGANASVIDSKSTTTELLWPIFKTAPNCVTECDRLVELRIYQGAIGQSRHPAAEPTYDLVTQLAITGPEESFVIAPLINATSVSQGSSRALPLTNLTRYEGTVPSPGSWFNLSGRRTRGDETAAYGIILHYNPTHHHLSVKLQWTSPAGEDPVWKDITGDKSAELIVNQTLGLEPRFEIYQVKPLAFIPSPVQLEPISLAEPALETPAYQTALLLARDGLWSTSLQWLQSLQNQPGKARWTPAAQAQMALVRWHAQATQTQAEVAWASPAQHVLANLLDDRWERALAVFEESAQASQETAALLKGDGQRLEKRIEVALRVAPNRRAVKAWGALLLGAQQTPAAAIAWVKKQPNTAATDIRRIQDWLRRLDPAWTDPKG